MRVLCALLFVGMLLALSGCQSSGNPAAATFAVVPATPTAVPLATTAPPTKTVAPEKPTAFVTVEPVATSTEAPVEDETPTLTPTISAAEAPTATMVAQLRATVVAGIRPTPTADTSESSFGGIDGVSIFPAKVAAGGQQLWVVHSSGSRSFDEPVQQHFVAIYTREGSGWKELSRLELENPDYLDENGVEQVMIEPGRLWLSVESGAGAHAGCLDILSFDGKALKDEVSSCNSSPEGGEVIDLNGDGTPEVVLNQSENYVFCYACGVRLKVYEVMRWDGSKLADVQVEKLPVSAPSNLRAANDRAVDLFNHELVKDAETEIEKAAKLDPGNDTMKWNTAIIKLHADARRDNVVDGGYPLLSNVFYGDYQAALDIMKEYKPEEIFTDTTGTPLIVGTGAEGSEDALTEWITETTQSALEIEPDLAAAHYLQGWAYYLHDPSDPKALNEIEKAAALDPNEALYRESVTYLKKR